MKTHDVAKVLRELAGVLLSGPNVDINLAEVGLVGNAIEKRRSSQGPESLELGLTALLALSRVNKSEWIRLIHGYGFPIDVRARDASRDILGKLLRFLEQNPDAREFLLRQAKTSRPDVSPELMRALASLLK